MGAVADVVSPSDQQIKAELGLSKRIKKVTLPSDPITRHTGASISYHTNLGEFAVDFSDSLFSMSLARLFLLI